MNTKTKLEQAQAKSKQGYTPNGKRCASCGYFSQEEKRHESPYGLGGWTEKLNKRCVLGGFPVKSNATCDEWVKK